MPEMHLRQPTFHGKSGKHGFVYSACGPLTKNKKRIQKSKEHEIKDTFIKVN